MNIISHWQKLMAAGLLCLALLFTAQIMGRGESTQAAPVELAGHARPSAAPSAPNSATIPAGLSPLPTSFTTDQDNTTAIAWGDVDRDGDLDLAVGNGNVCTPNCYGTPNKLYLNMGGVLSPTAAWVSNEGDATSALAWGDMNGDGYLDLAVGNTYQPARVYLNNGGMLQRSAVWSSSANEGAVAWGDVNGDGWADLTTGGRVYLNVNGMLATTSSWTPVDGGGGSPAWGDINGDGALDLAVCLRGGTIKVYLNQDGMLASTPIITTTDGGAWSIALGDVDGDGDLDLAAANDAIYSGRNKLYLNVGGTLSTTASWASAEDVWEGHSVAWADADGDGDLDLAAGGKQSPRVYANLGGTLALTPTWAAVDAGNVASLAWADVDGDGDLDLAAGNSSGNGGNRLYMNHGATLFPATANWVTSDSSVGATSVAWGDMNGDGRLDLGVARVNQNKVYVNTGDTLNPSPAWNSGTPAFLNVHHLAWGDVDGDGDLDLAAGNGLMLDGTGQPNFVYMNVNGMLQANPAWQAGYYPATHSVAWGDMDGDGDLDLAVGGGAKYVSGSTYPDSDRVYLNVNGTLQTSPVWTSADIDDTYDVAWGDIDGDGDLDLAAGNYLGPNKVYLNHQGMLGTAATWISNDADGTTAIAWGDADNDGDLDLAVGNLWGPVRIYKNTAGTLERVASWVSYEYGAIRDIAWGDADGDGDLDLVVANSEGIASLVYRNEDGELGHSAVWRAADSSETQGAAWGDINGDGILDLALADAYRGKVYQGLRPADPIDMQNTGRIAIGLTGDPVQTFSGTVTSLAPANFYAIPGIRAAAAIPFTYTLSDPRGEPVSQVRAFYSTDGGGHWAVAVPTTDTITRNLTTVQTWLTSTAPLLAMDEVDAISSTLTFSRTGQVGALTVRLTLSHTDSSQLAVALHSDWPAPTGTTVLLFDGVGWNRTGFADLTLSDYARYPITQERGGLVGYWKFDEGSGTTAVDASGHIATGTLLNGVAWSPTVPSTITFANPYALSFDGTDDYVNVPDNPSLDLSGGRFTEAMWIYPTLTDSDFHGFLGAQPGTIVTRYPGMWVRNYNAISAGFGYGTGNSGFTTGGILTNNAWNHVVATFDEVTYRIYVNGVERYTSNVMAGLKPYPGTRVYVGRIDNLFKGFIDDVRIYNRVLSPTEVAWLAAGNPDLTNPPLSGEYRPFEPLAAFQGVPLTSTFTLIVTDTTPGGAGTLVNWQLDVLPMTPTTRQDYRYTWDVFGSGFFGQSDNVVFRIEAMPNQGTPVNGTPGPFQRPFIAAQTYPFRVRGTQVRVMSDTVPVANALVYRLEPEQTQDGAPLVDATGRPFVTDGQGYLQGRGELAPGDRLLAMLPIAATDTYTLYYTSGTPALIGLDTYTVTASGVQTLTVSAEHPLLLFNLDVSLEWDAHNDAAYLEQLQADLSRASEYLYDFTNGQIALGAINVFQNADEWGFSHVVINANNRLRPFAAQGGVVITDTVDSEHADIRYSPGQVSMGSTWNRYGNPGQSLGDDWALILTHELSHYLLFHDDTYLGLDAAGFLIPITTCVGSAMGDLYGAPAATEFIADESYWQSVCAQTLAERTLGRTEWETMHLWYPDLVSPIAILSGPALMPFDFTDIILHDPYTPTTTLLDPTFYADYAGGGAASSEARAYLLSTATGGDYVVNLGSPYGGQNRILARGARPGDRLCAFDRPRAQFGCEAIALGDDRLSLRQDAAWNPVIQLTPLNTATLNLSVTAGTPITWIVYARLFPDMGYAAAPIPLTLTGDAYSGTFQLDYPVLAGHVQVWVDEPATETAPRRETVIAFNVGGNPGFSRGGGGFSRGGGGFSRGGGGFSRGGGGFSRGGGAPLISPDGQLIFFTENPEAFITGTLFTIQAMAGVPALPPGRTLVGQGYSLVASPGAVLPPGSVSLQYLSNDVLVAGAQEDQLALYFWNGAEWMALGATIDDYFNLATAPSQGPGVYALLASIQIPLTGPGWNLFAYPVAETRPVSNALVAISGFYTTVYGYDPTDATDPWKVFDVTVPQWVNDLSTLEFGKGYWINVSESITLYLASGTQPASRQMHTATVLDPPATFYGAVLDGPGFTPTEGAWVTAWIDAVVCGRARTRVVDGRVVYAVNVEAGTPGCGAPGRIVTFRINGQTMATAPTWQNAIVQELSLSTGGEFQSLYLPLVMKQ